MKPPIKIASPAESTPYDEAPIVTMTACANKTVGHETLRLEDLYAETFSLTRSNPSDFLDCDRILSTMTVAKNP